MLWLFILTTIQKEKMWYQYHNFLTFFLLNNFNLWLQIKQYFFISILRLLLYHIQEMSYFYITEFQCIADYRALQQKLLAKKWQVEIWLACKWESFLSCFVYVKYKTMLVKNTTLYFVESLIQKKQCRESLKNNLWESIQKVQWSEKQCQSLKV